MTGSGRRLPSRFCAGTTVMYSMGIIFLPRGPVIAAREKVEEKNLKNYLFLGEDRIRFQLSMEMRVNGSETLYTLIPGGLNWYEAGRNVRFFWMVRRN